MPYKYPSIMDLSEGSSNASHYILSVIPVIPSDSIEEENEKFIIEEYEDDDCSIDFPEQICGDFANSNDDPDQCILCGNVGKLFKISEAIGLSSKINKYLPFMKLQANHPDSICYRCLSTVNTWHSFYLNCSSINSKSSKITIDVQTQCPDIPNTAEHSLQQMIESLSSNSCNENMLHSVDVFTDGLKLLIAPSSNQSSGAPSTNQSTDEGSPAILTEKNFSILEDTEVAEITVNTSDADDKVNSEKSSPVTFKKTIWENEYDDDLNRNCCKKEKPIVKEVQTVKTLRNGTRFCVDDSYCFRVNKKYSGKTYVRCIKKSCPARGCIWKNLCRFNRRKHSHPPTHSKDSCTVSVSKEESFPLQNKELVIT